MTATVVDYTNLFSEARQNVLDLISSTSNVADPTISTTEFRKWIYSREPDVTSSDFKGYPYLILHPVEFNPEDGGSLDMKSKFVTWDIELEIVCSDRGYGSKDGMGLTHMDALSNSIVKTLLNVTNRKTLSTNNMNFVSPKTTAVTTEANAKELVYRRSIMVGFRGRIHVSA